ncbi:hypothetical protein, partial [Rhodococcus opacus]|uniref:hypothetical protein n=1 Tax=Rhodococcus opacus TaxID=37919 RepID=UPI0029531DBC
RRHRVGAQAVGGQVGAPLLPHPGQQCVADLPFTRSPAAAISSAIATSVTNSSFAPTSTPLVRMRSTGWRAH